MISDRKFINYSQRDCACVNFEERNEKDSEETYNRGKFNKYQAFPLLYDFISYDEKLFKTGL